MATFDTEHLKIICYGNQKSSFQNHHPMKPQNWPKKLDRAAKMKKVNKQCLLDTPRTVRVSEKTWQVIVRTRRLV